MDDFNQEADNSEHEIFQEAFSTLKARRQQDKRKEKVYLCIHNSRKDAFTWIETDDKQAAMVNEADTDEKYEGAAKTQDNQKLLNEIEAKMTPMDNVSSLFMLYSYYQKEQVNLKIINYLLCKLLITANAIKPRICRLCDSQMTFSKLERSPNLCVWRCYKSSCCLRKVEIRSQQTIFGQTTLDIFKQSVLFFKYFPRQQKLGVIKSDLDISLYQLKKIRLVYIDMILTYVKHKLQEIEQTKLGTRTTVVEIDESHYKRKYNRGRMRSPVVLIEKVVYKNFK